MKRYQYIAMQLGRFERVAGLVIVIGSQADVDRKNMYGLIRDGLGAYVRRDFPSGSGFDNGTKLDLDASTSERLVFNTAFHHMNEAGYYCEWSQHTVTVTPSLVSGFKLTISGRSINQIKEYIADTFHHLLDHELGDHHNSVESLMLTATAGALK